jgi:hypothetical protein
MLCALREDLDDCQALRSHTIAQVFKPGGNFGEAFYRMLCYRNLLFSFSRETSIIIIIG